MCACVHMWVGVCLDQTRNATHERKEDAHAILSLVSVSTECVRGGCRAGLVRIGIIYIIFFSPNPSE
jgi:hypothetical protein